MELFGDTPFRTGWLPGRLRPGTDTLTIAVKGTFTFVPGGKAAPVEEDEQAHLSGDVHLGDDPAASALYGSDFELFKPRGEALVMGACHAPRGEARSLCTVGLEIGSLQKRLAIIGDRYWREGPLGLRPTEPVPFKTMPLVAENAFGGPGIAANPVGKGISPVAGPGGVTAVPLPNIEHPDRLIRTPDQRPDPVSLGPLHRRWAPRANPRGTFGEAWLSGGGWPGLPADFDLGYFQTAPPDQQIEGYFRGDEVVAIDNLDPELPHAHTRLPGLRLRCFVTQSPVFGEAFREVPLRLDTVWIDGGARRLHLVWRGLVRIKTRRYEELDKILVAAEPLEDKPLPPRHYQAPSRWEKPRDDDAPAEKETDDEADDQTSEQGVAEEVKRGMDDVRAMLEKSKLPPDTLSRLRGVNDPDAFLAILLTELRHDPAAAERVEQEASDRVKKLLVDQGQDPSLVDRLDAPDDEEDSPGSPWSRELVKARAAAKGSFVNQDLRDLDLSGLDLSGLDFTLANLSRSSLEGACLDKATLEQAVLHEADLRGASLSRAVAGGAELYRASLQKANLSGAFLGDAGLREADLADAKLDEADLTGATLAGAKLERASLAGASFEQANLSGAVLAGATGAAPRFVQADLTEADLRQCALPSADFSGATLDRAKLSNAALREASFFGATGAGAAFDRSDLTGAKAGDGCKLTACAFGSVQADGAAWNDTDLTGSDFRGASLIRASFTGGVADRASFHRAILKHADFSFARLREARLVEANLFQSRLESADLTGADLRRSNLYGSELLDAITARACFDGANLKATKLVAASGGGQAS